jgi:hypothetical protein
MPLLTAWRVAQEREWADLLYFTPLPINQLVWGKAASGICLAGLYLSACLPFLMFSTLLRGVDFLTILAVLSLLFTAVGVTAIVAVAVGAAPVPRMLRPLLLWGFGAGLMLLVFGLVQGLRPVIQNGMMGDFPVFVYLLTASFVGLTGYGLSMTFINPRERGTKTRQEQLQHDGQAHG